MACYKHFMSISMPVHTVKSVMSPGLHYFSTAVRSSSPLHAQCEVDWVTSDT